MNFHIKDQKKKLTVNGKNIAKLNGKYFICNKTRHLDKVCKNRTQESSLKEKWLLKSILIGLITSPIKFHKWTCLLLFSKSTKQKILSSGRLILMQQDIYAPRRKCSPLTKKWMVNTKVLGIGKVLLKMTYKKKLTLNYMLHVAHIRMNLMFGSLLSKNDSKLIFKSDKFVLFKNKVCIWEGYLNDDLLKVKGMINVSIDEKKNNYNTYFSYILESYN